MAWCAPWKCWARISPNWAIRCATPPRKAASPCRCPPIPKSAWRCSPRHAGKRDPRFRADAVHIATEGTLGLSARAICIKYCIQFSTSFHTRFPEYVKARFPFVPLELVYGWLRWFHGPAQSMMVATESLKREMAAHGFHHLRIWSRGWMWTAFTRSPARICPMTRRSGFMSAGWRWRRISRISWHWIFPAPSWWWATGRQGRRCRRNIPKSGLWARLPARHWSEPMPPSTVFVFSQLHRHIRAGLAGSAGLWLAGSGLSGAGAAGRGG